MKLSVETLAAVGAPGDLLSRLGSQFGNGPVEYQVALDTLARTDRPDLAIALMDCVGPDDSAHLDVNASYNEQPLATHLFAAGDLTISGDCHLVGWVRAGSHIDSDASIRAQLGVVSGASIRVAQNLHTDGAICSGGRIDVGGYLSAQGHIHSGYAITIGKAIQAGADIKVGLEAQRVFDALVTIYETNDDPENLVVNAVSGLLEACIGVSNPFQAFAEGRMSSSLKVGGDIAVGADLSCIGDICSGGTIRVGGEIHAGGEICSSRDLFARTIATATSVTAKGQINIDEAVSVKRSIDTHGDLLVRGDIVLDEPRSASIRVGGVLRTDGSIECSGPVTAVAITVGGNVSAASLRTIGNLTVGGEVCARRYVVCSLGAISAEGSIFAGGSIQAGGSVRSAGEIVHGDGYGLFAGTITHSSGVLSECQNSPAENSEILALSPENAA